MVKIRMMRMGSKKSPFYRLIAIDERKQRDGRPLEFLGTYDPRQNPPIFKVDLDSVDAWIGKGAQLSGTVKSIVNNVRRNGNTPVPPPNPPAIFSNAAAAKDAVAPAETSLNG